MIKKHPILMAAAFFSATIVAVAQDFKFGKVSDAELQESVHPIDSSASAAILYKKGRTYLDYNNRWEYVHEVEARMKIYNKDGYDEATIEVPLYKGKNAGSKESLSGLRAFTYNMENGKMTEEKLGNDGEFEEEVNERWMLKKFTFPNVKEGSVLEYKYVIRSPFTMSLPEWQFQYEIPVNDMEYVTEIPEYFYYKEFNKGYYQISRSTATERETKTVRYTYNEAGTSAIDAQKTKTGSVEYNKIVSTYKAKNIPRIKEESYVNNIDNYVTSLKHELSYTKMPGSSIEYYNQSWEDVTKSIYDYSNFGSELKINNYFKGDLDPILAQAASPVEKAAVVFNFVKQKMTWNGTYGYGCQQGVKKAYKEGTGNVGDINLMLTSMLRYAGLTANPVLVSTRSHGIPIFPTTDGFNYVVAAIELDGGTAMLDATDPYSLPNILPVRTLNWMGRLIRDDGTSMSIDLMPSKQSKEVVNMNIELAEDGHIDGKCRIQFTDHLAMSLRKEYAAVDQEKYLENMANNMGDLEISEFKIDNDKELGKPVIETFELSRDNSADIIADKIYFSPMFFAAMKENPFKLDVREYPIDYSYPRQTRYLINVKIPEGYQVESLPEGMAMSLPDELGSFSYNITNNQGNIQLVVSFEIKSSIISPLYYEAVKEYYNKLVEKETEKIVLTKT